MPTEIAASLGQLLPLSQLIHESRNLEPLLADLITRAVALPNVDTIRILLLDAERAELVAQPGTFPTSPDDESIVPVGVGFAGQIAQNRTPLLVEDLKEFPVQSAALRRAGLRGAVGVPLLVGERLIGVMHIGSRRLGIFKPDIIPVLEALAEQVALTIDAIQAEADLRSREERFRTLFEAAPIGVCLTYLDPTRTGHTQLANPALSAITGYSAEQLATMNLLDVLEPSDRLDAEAGARALAAGDTQGYSVERQMRRADGSSGWLRATVTTVAEEGRPWYALCYIEDITARKLAEEELTRHAFTDTLTGLCNRNLVIEQLALALRQEPRARGMVGVIYLDIDHFKDINDGYGHDVGDLVLRETARRMSATVRGGDTAARMGGDEFAIVCTDLAGIEELDLVASRLLQVLSADVAIGTDLTLPLGVSIGIVASDRAAQADELLRRADLAMYEAKRLGRGRLQTYAAVLDRPLDRRRGGAALVRSAVEEGWLRLHYQPIVDLRTSEAIAAEALLRIEHPERGLLLPAEFIGHLEDSDLGPAAELWVLRRACEELASGLGTRVQRLAINVSGRLASSGRLSTAVLGAAHAARIDPSRLCIDLTEQLFLRAEPGIPDDLLTLTGNGVTLAIDDFGAGHASLRYLLNFPVKTVKFHRSLIAGLGTKSPKETVVVKGVLSLAEALDLEVIAEGVETAAQAEALTDIGCRLAQGYLFGRPGPVSSLAG